MRLIKIAFFAFCMLFVMPVAFAEVTVFIDDTQIIFEDQPPVIIEERTFVPLRKIFEELGAAVDWVEETKSVFAAKRFSAVSFTIGEEDYYVDGELKKLDAPAVILNERTLVPVRAVSEALGAEVLWIKAENKVQINLKHGEHIIKDRYINGWECADDGTIVFTYRAAYPELMTDDSVCRAFNEFFRGDAEEACMRAAAECVGSAKEAYEQSLITGNEFVPYMAEHSFDITYNKDDIISVVCSDCNFSGGFHPSYVMYSMTYSLKTGKLINCTDILSIQEAELHKKVYNLFKTQIEKNPDIYYEDALACLDESLSELKWYLAEDGVHFFLNPYEIAPYASGVVEVVVPT